ncbi:MAG: hypothetical protein EHM14_13880 [Methanothrix sp.]|nr:MAG: hypothetical protein EHM14_13880 [Methanothrix sp.]
MNHGNILIILMLVLMLLAGSATATNCIVYAVDEYNMPINNAIIYLDDWSHRIGSTTYNAAIGRNCWVGDVPEGQHTLNVKWDGVARQRPAHEGSATVNIGASETERITILIHKVA